MIMDGYDDWNDRTARFVHNVVLYFNIELPGTLAVRLFAIDCDDEGEDEDEDGDEDEDNDEA
jgi:hypothetical protein